MPVVPVYNVGDLGQQGGEALEVWLTEDGLSRLAPEEAMEAVRKDSVWPQPNWRSLVADGMTPGAAALIKLIRDRIPPRPNYRVRQLGTHHSVRAERDPALVQRDYVRMLGIVRDRLLVCNTQEQVRAARALILEDAGWHEDTGWHEGAGAEAKHLVTSVWRDRLDTLQLDYRDVMASDTMVQEGWPGAASPSWRKGYSVRGDGEGGYLLARGVRIEHDGFLTEEAAWDWLRASIVDRRAAVAAAPIPARPALENLVRVGMPDRRRGRNVEVLELLDAFSLRAVEFGKWVPHPERQELLNRAYDALHDLAGAFGLDADAIGLGGTLALSFGARSAGNVGADYDPRLRVVAMPRVSGAGELARCWGKAFDHWAGETGLSAKPAFPRPATGRAARGREPVPDTGHLLPSESAAWWRVHVEIWRRDPGAAAEAASLRTDIARREAEVARTERQRDAFLERVPDAASTPDGAAYLSDTAAWLAARRDRVLPALHGRLAEAEERSLAAGESAYAAEARKLCGRDGDFWMRPTEIFGRAFEACVHDTIAAAGGHSGFLVHGVEEDRFSNGFRGNPFPAGAERERIGLAVSALVAEMAPRLAPEGQERDLAGKTATPVKASITPSRQAPPERALREPAPHAPPQRSRHGAQASPAPRRR